MTVNVDGEKYEGSGASKKMAKHACARSALTKLYHMSFTPHMQGNKIHSVLAYLRLRLKLEDTENVQSTYRISGRSAGFSSILLEGDQKNDEIVPGKVYYVHTHFNRHKHRIERTICI